MGTALMWLATAVSFDVVANIALKYSIGFRYKKWGGLALLCIMAAFACLAQAVQTVELSIAYALWGALGLCVTAGVDYFLFGQRLNKTGWLGILLIVVGIVMLHQIGS